MPSLALGSSAMKQSRKYLGDMNDPHFIPKSPLIERQKLSAQDEDELKCMCFLALANVPHSDTDVDDPFRYLASQITVGKAPLPSTRNAHKVSGPVLEQIATVNTLASHPAETATPSECSKRETLQTSSTTPMTTPGETISRFSDSGKRPIATPSSILRSEVKGVTSSATYSFLNEPLPSRPQLLPAASRSMTHLPNLFRQRSKHNITDSRAHETCVPMGQPDFNKSLPSIPKSQNDRVAIQEPTKEKPRGLTRMLRSVRLQRTQTTPDVVPRGVSVEFMQKRQDILDRSTTRKHRFNLFSFLHTRSDIDAKRATVG